VLTVRRLFPDCSPEVTARLLSLAVNVGLLSSAANVRLTWLMCYLLIYLRPLLLNEPFVITVDTSVKVTMELLLLPMQRSIRSVSMEASLLDSKHDTIYISSFIQIGPGFQNMVGGYTDTDRNVHT
jgi:hypothetical protein